MGNPELKISTSTKSPTISAILKNNHLIDKQSTRKQSITAKQELLVSTESTIDKECSN